MTRLAEEPDVVKLANRRLLAEQPRWQLAHEFTAFDVIEAFNFGRSSISPSPVDGEVKGLIEEARHAQNGWEDTVCLRRIVGRLADALETIAVQKGE